MSKRYVEQRKKRLLMASQIFSTGKSLNFIRYSCHDSDWVATRNKLDHTGKGNAQLLQAFLLIEL
jgi:Gamma tubulin complex component N-terminal